MVAPSLMNEERHVSTAEAPTLGEALFWKYHPLIMGVVLLTLGIFSCEDMGGPPPRIIPGVSIDGVRLGDSKERVEAVLGYPFGAGWIDGTWRSWRAYAYGNDPGTHRYALTIGFIEIIDESPIPAYQSSCGPVDKVSMNQGYTGTTREGIGIGTSMEKVLRFWGPPRRWAGDYACYCFANKFFEFLFKSDTVRLMSTGFFIACPADTFHTCN